MDPDAALDRIRELCSVVLDDGVPLLRRKSAAEDLAELVRELDQWLSRGGFLPRPWRMLLRPADGEC